MTQNIDMTCGEHKHWLCISHLEYKVYGDRIEVTSTIDKASREVIKVRLYNDERMQFDLKTLPSTISLTIYDWEQQPEGEDIINYYNFLINQLKVNNMIKLPIDYILCNPHRNINT